MSTININRVVLTGNLTRDPELRATASGLPVCSLRVASTAQRKSSNGEGYEERPNYFTVTVWGSQGENAAVHLTKGRPVAIDGRLEWREWEDAEGEKHHAVDIVADSVQFLNRPAASTQDQFQLQVQDSPPPRPAPRTASQRRYTRPKARIAA
jgi:single-strand DNA-binding protein